LAAFTTIIASYVIFYLVTSLLANNVKTADYDGKLFFMINLTLLFLQFIFIALGMLVSVFFKKLKSVLPISLGMVFGLYMAGALIATEKNNDAARFISPFKYFDITYIIKNASYEAAYMIAGAIIIVISIAASYIIYIKKDIHAVS
jgi:ABC-2 type transport system permease protein